MATSHEPGGGAGRSTTVDRGAAVLRHLAEHPQGLSITDLTRVFDTQRAPMYRVMNSLIAYQLVRRDARKNYMLGVGTVSLARAYLSQFPSGIDSVLSALADESGLTVTLIAADGDVLTTVTSVTSSREAAHLFTPPGYVFPDGPLATRTALRAAEPPEPDEDPDVTEARAKGYATTAWTQGIVRHGISAVVPHRTNTGTRLSVAMIALEPFPEEPAAQLMLAAVETLGLMLHSDVSRISPIQVRESLR